VGELVGGKYRISRLIAEGGMGVVYEAQHTIVKRRFAVKFLRPDLADKRESLGRFQREAEAAGSLESEHIASVVDFGITADGSAFIVMEYLAGESLAALLEREGPLPVERATDLCIQACHGAETAHAAGIVHRDLKPHNLFVCRRDDRTDLLKILDFGIAKLEASRHEHASIQTGSLLGTPAYMSPEQARGEKTIDLRTDVYSLGAILFEMLSGKHPHPGDSPNSVLYHISTQPPVSLATAAPELPAPLALLVDRTVASTPETRPRSARELAAELAQFAKRETRPEATVTDGRTQGRRWVYTIIAASMTATAVALFLFGRTMSTAPTPTPTERMSKQDRLTTAKPPSIPPPARTASMPAPSVGDNSGSPLPTDSQTQAPAKARTPTQSRGSGRSSGSVAGRATTGPVESPREPRSADTSAEGSAPSRPAFPRPAFDPNNPYANRER
jgi:serine/threonine-protein kinase